MNNYVKDPHTQAILDTGMKALYDTFDLLDLETFLVYIRKPGFDYTEWRENLWEDLTPEELFEQCRETAKKYKVPDHVKTINI
jgi:hypothetical protein